MRIAFHFVAPTDGNFGNYAVHYLEILFKILFANKINIHSKISFGDLLIRLYSCETVEETQCSTTQKFSRSKYDMIFERWTISARAGWHRMSDDNAFIAYRSEIFVIFLDTIGQDAANIIHNELSKIDGYNGAFEISDVSNIQWVLYTQSIPQKYRIAGKSLFIFWNGLGDEDSKDEGMLNHWKDFGFNEVHFESLEMQGTIFDACNTIEHAQALAKWRDNATQLLSSIVDNITYKLIDAAPDIGIKLNSAVDAYLRANTSEDMAHAALSCRRTIEYVANVIFPPQPEEKNAPHKLGKKEFKNRLLKFVEDEKKSNTSIELITASMGMLNEQLEKLLDLQNKGLHDEITHQEARRCIIRTLVIIDDIMSLRKLPMPASTKLKIPWDVD